MVISFSSEKPRLRLLAGEKVYTARLHRRKQFTDKNWGKALKDWACERRCGPKIADVFIWEIGHVDTYQLELYRDSSGFDSMEEWLKELNRLIKWKDIRRTDRFWLYMVQERGAAFKPSAPS